MKDDDLEVRIGARLYWAQVRFYLFVYRVGNWIALILPWALLLFIGLYFSDVF
jgi:hypothetical protein